MIVDLIDGTYELFRHFYGLQRFKSGNVRPFGAVNGVLATLIQMIEEGATHLGVATDHVIESFRNDLWADYKTGDDVDPALQAQFEPLEQAVAALGVSVWPMTEVEADDALASAARIAEADRRVRQVRIWTPDKDLAQCVRGDRVVQVERRTKSVRNEAAVLAKFGVHPERMADYLALVGDRSDGYPGIAGIGPKNAAALISRYGALEDFPSDILGPRRDAAQLFKRLAQLRTDLDLFDNVDALRWRGCTASFSLWAERLETPRLLTRAQAAASASIAR